MNLTDNGITKVLEIERINEEFEMCFLVKFLDYYGHEKTRKVMDITNIDKLTWRE